MVAKASGHECQKPVSNVSPSPPHSVLCPWTNHVKFLDNSQVLFLLTLAVLQCCDCGRVGFTGPSRQPLKDGEEQAWRTPQEEEGVAT